MADPVIQFLIQKISSFLEEEASLFTGVRKEAEDMRKELQRMNAFLIDEGERSGSTEQLKLWVTEVREVAYDTEDLLDKFTIHLASNNLENRLNRCLRAICFSFKNFKARREIALEIRRLKHEVASIAEGHRRYIDPNLPQHSTINSNWRNVQLLPLDAEHAVGIEKPKRQLIQWLIGGGSADSRLKCISVVGMGGCGKTTLVQQVYGDAAVKQCFNSHLWLVVSVSFDIIGLLVKIIQCLFAEIEKPTPQGLNSMDVLSLRNKIASFLERRRYIIVIDDVWNVGDWVALKRALPENNCGSRILLTTRKEEVALKSRVDTNGHTYQLGSLPENAAWALFTKRAFQDACCPLHLEEIARSILGRCKGLPLAIVTIAGVLLTKDPNNIGEWEIFCKRLPYELEDNERMKRLLSLSYNELPHYLKMCYLYMYIFPEDYEIERMMLIRLWNSEGFVQVTEGMTVEEVAESYIHDLANRSLVQVAKIDERGRLRMIRIHDVLRDVILSRAREQSLVTTSSKGSTNSWPQTVRRLAIHDSEGICKVSSSNSFNGLRSLIILENTSSLPLSNLVLVLSSSKLLRVLNLTGVQLEEVPDEVFELVHLRYLCMRRTGLKSLSKKIGKLYNLETLDLKHTHITHLPSDILKLRRLRHLLVYRYNGGFYPPFDSVKGCKFPCGISSLLSLQKVRYVDASNDVIVKELGKLTELRRLGITRMRRKDGSALCDSIVKLTNLRSLSIRSMDEDEILDVESLTKASPLRFLQTLELSGPLRMVPTWIQSLQSLVQLSLRWTKLREEPLNSLHGLPNLRYLRLLHAYEGEGLQFKAGGFQRLKQLFLYNLKELRWVTIEEHSMPELEELHIEECELMEELPVGIQHLTKLQGLNLLGIPILIEQFQDKGRKHQDYRKLSHIPRVVLGYVKYGRISVFHL